MSVELVIIIGLLITNAVSLGIMIRARVINNTMAQNYDNLKEWLVVQKSLQKAGRCHIVIKQVDEDSLFVRKPSR